MHCLYTAATNYPNFPRKLKIQEGEFSNHYFFPALLFMPSTRCKMIYLHYRIFVFQWIDWVIYVGGIQDKQYLPALRENRYTKGIESRKANIKRHNKILRYIIEFVCFVDCVLYLCSMIVWNIGYYFLDKVVVFSLLGPIWLERMYFWFIRFFPRDDKSGGE